jgi:predicted acylesterase/phospholipase RssA
MLLKLQPMLNRRTLLQGLGAGGAVTTVSACDAPARLASLPEKLRVHAPFRGMPEDCRIALDGSDDDVLGRIGSDALHRELEYAQRNNRDLGPASFLAISGGGENGAYGAGLLTGWTQLGTRPEFKGVTGVSTGALSAPFAFLGPDYDQQLERVYTQISLADVMVSRGLLTALLSDSAYDSTPLLHMIRGFVTPAFLSAIAAEYQKGRLLMVATTNLDVPVGMLWNMGAIASSGHPRAGELFAHILLASASIPGVFPPVMIDIEVGDDHYQEMHVDGGTMTQVVLYPPSFGRAEMLKGFASVDPKLVSDLVRRQRRLYVIRNACGPGERETVARSTIKIASRAVSTLIQTQGTGDLYRLYVIAQRDGIDYNVAYIPDSFKEKLPAPFDQAYMRKLYAVGREAMLQGTPWHKQPPGFDATPLHLEPDKPVASRL